MSIAEPLSVLKSELLQKIVPEVVELLAPNGFSGPFSLL